MPFSFVEVLGHPRFSLFNIRYNVNSCPTIQKPAAHPPPKKKEAPRLAKTAECGFRFGSGSDLPVTNTKSRTTKECKGIEMLMAFVTPWHTLSSVPCQSLLL